MKSERISPFWVGGYHPFSAASDVHQKASDVYQKVLDVYQKTLDGKRKTI